MQKRKKIAPPTAAALIRHLFLAWLFSALLEYLFLPQESQSITGLGGIAAMSLPRLLILTAVFTAILWALFQRYNIIIWERWAIVGAFGLLAGAVLTNTYTDAFFLFCAVILAALAVYAIWGHAPSPEKSASAEKVHWVFPVIVALLALVFFVIVSLWTVYRVKIFWAPSFDFGLFAQMFHNMKETGLAVTTVERGKYLSHFAVHVSPIYYLMLPFYCLFPVPETLQILQAAVLASAVIPMWLIGKQNGLGGLSRTLLCALLLLVPATAGGASYDLHENCFLLPLVLWLMYAIDRKSLLLTGLFTVLTLAVKEDAAVYVAIAALYLIIRCALNFHKSQKKMLFAGIGMLVLSIAWFLLVTDYLANHGDGVMTYRYNNFIYDGSGSLLSVIKAVILCPMKMLYECVDAEKLTYLAQTMLPLLALPLITRKFERYLLLIPYILLNLMSDYQYQHDIMFQYNFGSGAFLLYLTAVNLADIKWQLPRLTALAAAVCVSFGFFTSLILPQVENVQKNYAENTQYYEELSQALAVIPDDASVAAHHFYVTPLSNRAEIYDIHNYCSSETILKCEYVAVKKNCKSKYYNTDVNGYAHLVSLLEENGYEIVKTYGSLVIYQKEVQ